MLKSFAAYAAALSCVLAVAAIAVHILMASEYRTSVSQRLVILTHDAEEVVEENVPGEPIAPALARVLRSTDEGVALFDARGRLVAAAGATGTANARAASLRVETMRGGWIRATISNERVAALMRQLDLVLAAGVVIVALAGGLVIAWISALAVARVESAFQRVTRFTGDAAHELRTPLAVITTNADRLWLDASRDAERTESLENIRRAARQMRHLMDGLLLLARADRQATLDLHAIDVDASIESVVQAHRAQAEAGGVQLAAYARSGVTIYGQPEQVARIVGNLVENALTYTPAGGRVDVTSRAEHGGVAIEVADTGVGIAPEVLGRVFDRFWRGGGTPEGFGLGLAIVQSLARAQGGDVHVRSTLGQGTTFTVKLSVKPQRAAGFSTIS